MIQGLGVAAVCVLMMAGSGPAGAQVIHSFQGSPDDGALPLGGLISDGGRALYGTTYSDGNAPGVNGYSFGTIYRLEPPALPKGPWHETVLYNFPANSTDGTLPTGDLLSGLGGVLYGVTASGGVGGGGIVYSLARPAEGTNAWTETVLHGFTSAEGSYLSGGVVAGPAGALYGVAAFSGPLDNEGGAVFQLTPPAAGQTQWTEQTLHAFGGPADGANPFGSLLRDAAGNLYGTTQGGGSGPCRCGVVYELSPPVAGQTVWTETVLHEFVRGLPGSVTRAGLVMDRAGVLYGTTLSGGEVNTCRGCGVVFKLAPPAQTGGAWRYDPIFLFNGTDGGVPSARLTLSLNGNLYGTTDYGGVFKAACNGGCGAIFKLTRPSAGSGMWTETYVAVPGRYAGRELQADVLIGPDHALYTTASEGGFKGHGSVLRVTPDQLTGVGTDP